MRIRIITAVLAAAFVGLSTQLPLWSMSMKAPQYPKGLRLEAYGSGMVGDIRELSILNHYIGALPLDPTPALETAVYPWAIGAVVVLCLLAPVHRWVRRFAITATAAAPFAMMADIQWRLYQFGHTMDPKAPIRLKPFTPLVLGPSTLGNFQTEAMIAGGALCLFAAAALLLLGARLSKSRASAAAPVRPAMAAAVTVLVLAPGSAFANALQARIDAAPKGSLLRVDGGVHSGPIVVRGPLRLIGVNGPVIDGGGRGSVVTIEGDDVVFEGFVVRNSGREVTEEAAGITVTGNRHRIAGNHVHDVYFGIHVAGGVQHVVEDNRIAPGQEHGARPGHGISVWHTKDSRLLRNRISDARDGIYLSFTEGILAADNEVTGCRYGLHSMYSQQATFSGNRVIANLLGSALMNSDHLVLRGNRIERHREGSAAYGILLKDIGALIAEGNTIVGNRVGLYAEGVPSSSDREAVFRNNVIAANEVALALQSTAALTLTGNRIADNLTDVRPLGRQLSPAMKWSSAGRGNAWSQYRGYDANGDGIGDVPHRVEDAMDALVRKNSMTQAFLYTPAHLALEAGARLFPLLRQPPLVVDEFPIVSQRGPR
jgi:nitrous oxidase accessory protein